MKGMNIVEPIRRPVFTPVGVRTGAPGRAAVP
jgi:hypothetical protein